MLKFLDRFKSFYSNKTSVSNSVSFSFFENGTACVSLVQNSTEKPIVKVCEFIEHSPKERETAIEQFIRQHELEEANCAWILEPSDYKLLMIDALDVEEDELIAAAKWRVKDLLNFSIDEAAIQVFEIPNLGSGRQRRKMYVVAVAQHFLEEHVLTLKNISLKPMFIDIPELCLQNLPLLISSESHNYAFLVVQGKKSNIMIVYKDYLCFSRNVKISADELLELKNNPDAEGEIKERLLVEIQRSYDYCQSELGLNAPEHLYLDPLFNSHTSMTDYINENLPSKITTVNLNQLFTIDKTISDEEQNRFLASMSGGLRFIQKNNLKELVHAKD